MTAAHASYDEAADWYADIRRARAEQVLDVADGVWALLSPAHANSFVHNTLLVRRDPGGDALVAWADEVLGGAGLAHRHLVLQCPVAEATLVTVVAAGYTVEPEVVMSRPSALGPMARHDVVIEQVDPVASSDFEARLWREEWIPGIGDAELGDLLSRRSAMDVAGPYLTFVVRDADGTIVAAADMAVRGDGAEIDGVATWPEHRGKGYGDALVAACVDEAIARGIPHLHLEALTDDWPRHWYARRGWAELGPFTSATRRP
jgi:N-acetylglutamate synthase-like GNAT family acetyltransferase